MSAHDAAAFRIRKAYSEGTIPPLRDLLDPLDGEGAYQVQLINTRFWQDQGRHIVGRKIGLTSDVVQRQLGVDRPDFGILFADMRVEDGGILPVGSVIQPKAEAEIALIMGKDLSDPEATPQDILDAAESAVTAIEIVDSRIADWKITFADTVADNGSSAFFVLGERRVPLKDIDLLSCSMTLEMDGILASSGTAAACLGHPLNAAAWLARTLAGRGEGLRQGDIVLTGALGPMVALAPDAHVKADISGLGTAQFRMGAA